jgi:hypothetical protein
MISAFLLNCLENMPLPGVFTIVKIRLKPWVRDFFMLDLYKAAAA